MTLHFSLVHSNRLYPDPLLTKHNNIMKESTPFYYLEGEALEALTYMVRIC
jgi:hypothetical protein